MVEVQNVKREAEGNSFVDAHSSCSDDDQDQRESQPALPHHPLRSFFFPLYQVEGTMSNRELRDVVTTITSNTSLCSAIIGGVSVTALLATLGMGPPPEATSIFQVFDLVHPTYPYLERGWGRYLAHPLLLASTFTALQNMITSMMTQSYVWAVPISHVDVFMKKHTYSFAACGWLMVPSLGFLAMGLAAISEATFAVSPLFPVSALFLLGATSTLQTGVFLRTAYKLRKYRNRKRE